MNNKPYLDKLPLLVRERENILSDKLDFLSGTKTLPFYKKDLNRIANKLNLSEDVHSRILGVSIYSYRRYSTKKHLPIHAVEVLLWLINFDKIGLVTFDINRRKLNNWLSCPNIALGHSIPENLLVTTSGIRLVGDMLIRMNYGILS